jgi:hypothetical protein
MDLTELVPASSALSRRSGEFDTYFPEQHGRPT